MSDSVFIVMGRDAFGEHVTFTFAQRDEYREFTTKARWRGLMEITDVHEREFTTAERALEALEEKPQ